MNNCRLLELEDIADWTQPPNRFRCPGVHARPRGHCTRHRNYQHGQVDDSKIKLWTARDPVFFQVIQFVLQGWPSEIEEEALKPYFIRREELSVHAGFLLWGARVMVPP